MNFETRNTDKAKEMVHAAIVFGTPIFVHKYCTVNFYRFTFETINNNGFWETKITRTSYTVDENGKATEGHTKTEQRVFNNLKQLLHSDYNTLSNTSDEMISLCKEVWRQEKAKHQKTILSDLFA